MRRPIHRFAYRVPQVAVAVPSANVAVTPSTLALSLATFAPTVYVSDNKSVTPSVLSLVLTSYTLVILAPGPIITLVTPDEIYVGLTGVHMDGINFGSGP